MAIAADGAWPSLWLIMPDGCVVVQAESQVVLDQVLPRRLHSRPPISSHHYSGLSHLLSVADAGELSLNVISDNKLP